MEHTVYSVRLMVLYSESYVKFLERYDQQYVRETVRKRGGRGRCRMRKTAKSFRSSPVNLQFPAHYKPNI